MRIPLAIVMNRQSVRKSVLTGDLPNEITRKSSILLLSQLIWQRQNQRPAGSAIGPLMIVQRTPVLKWITLCPFRHVSRFVVREFKLPCSVTTLAKDILGMERR
ncbi:MAG: hypothetical protein A2341_19725 [Deltaproteobacteria bacterium RIFOXYB12_FULL_58_9]|nr:MAG: hypothetical protein A2341_19725 [Deltaproteobacteria bacterium RIFOXYB12_FULL_58_9]